MSGIEIRYSEAFKQQVVEEVASGRFRSAHEAARAYGVKDCKTVRRWMRQYGKGELPTRPRAATKVMLRWRRSRGRVAVSY